MQDSKSFNYQIIGQDSSPKLVFLHGIMGQGRNWGSIAKKFSKNFQCLLFDQRGHGGSIQPEKGYELVDYVQDLFGLLNDLGWQEPIALVGHSMGGRVALKFADQYSERLNHLVIVDIGPTSDWSSMSSILEKLNFVPTPFNDRKEARQFFETQFMERYQSKMLMEFFYSNLTEKESGYDWVFSKSGVRQTLELSRYKDYWAEFKNLQCPTLLIRGGESGDLSPEDFDKVLANNQRIAGKTVQGAGHWVHAEKPRETIKIIEDFFNIAPKSEQ